MLKYLLDTDHLAILERKSQPECARLLRRIALVGEHAIAISIISFQEQTAGWLAYIQRARSNDQLRFGYERLAKLIPQYSAMPVLTYCEQSIAEFDSFRQSRIRVGTLGLRIAAIAKVRGLVVLTRNLRDFQQIPGAPCEDWTRPESPPDS